MGIICSLFGHKTSGDKYNGGEYMETVGHEIDGIGRGHTTIYAKCRRCKKRFRVGMIHVTKFHQAN